MGPAAGFIPPGSTARMNYGHWLRLASVVAWLALPARPAAAAPLPGQVSGPEACAQCHTEEIEVWKLTKHFKTFREMPRRPEARDIAAKLGITNIKSESLCLQCHFLSQTTDNQTEVIAGIACESCHGAAKDWVDVHGDYGKGFKQATEPAEHRTARLARSIAGGMIVAGNLYSIGSNCYGCHIVTDEKLANVGGHSPGSPGFNLLTWSQGEVRHTILHTGNKANPPATPEHQRRLFVLGCILEVEFSFRAVGRATEKATYAVTHARRADAARKLLEKIQSLAPTPELAAIVAVAKSAGLRLNNGAELNAAADKISVLGREFAAKVTGDQLAGIDAILPGPDQYKGVAYKVAGQP